MPKLLHSLLPKSLHFWLPFTLASTAKDNELGQVTTPTPSTTRHGEFFSGSLGLLNVNSSYNAADAEANQEMAEILRRKKKRKRGMRL